MKDFECNRLRLSDLTTSQYIIILFFVFFFFWRITLEANCFLITFRMTDFYPGHGRSENLWTWSGSARGTRRWVGLVYQHVFGKSEEPGRNGWNARETDMKKNLGTGAGQERHHVGLLIFIFCRRSIKVFLIKDFFRRLLLVLCVSWAETCRHVAQP